MKQFKNQRLQQNPSTVSFSGTAADTKTAQLGDGIAQRIHVVHEYTVTDASVSAGENIAGAMTVFEIANGGDVLLYAEKDEIGVLVQALKKGSIAGHVIDADPTTATATSAIFTLEGPFNLKGAQAKITMNPIGEWATASAFVDTVYFIIEYSDKSLDEVRYTKRVHREYRATSVRHDVSCGNGAVLDILIKGATAANLKKAQMLASVQKNGIQTAIPYVSVDNYAGPTAAYAALAESATTTGLGYFPGVNAPEYPNRLLTVEYTTTDTLLAFFVNMVGLK